MPSYVNYKRKRNKRPTTKERAALRSFVKAFKKTCDGQHRTSALWLEKEIERMFAVEVFYESTINELKRELEQVKEQLATAIDEISRLHKSQ